ncbi:WD40 repeat domain-containing protein [Sulfurimonas sp.]|uniref:WD40 repeat domain-containing protein n=1 Tax=Sulfurimonas sp. TaxID=2022749 RepID=UPI002AB2628C|nr:WD40 repeat domain-containing protein [Sulfurimonas sp.]
MTKILLLTIFITSLLMAEIKMPKKIFISSGAVTDMLVSGSKLYSSTHAGCIDIFNLKSKKIIKKIKVSQIEDFMGDKADSKIYSVDVLDNQVLILSQAKRGFRRVHIYKNDKLELIIPYTKSLTISKAKFIDEDNILLGMLSNELISYNIKTKTKNWLVQVSGAKFSDFALNEIRSEVVVADESGSLKIHSVKDGRLLKTLEGQNLDNVFQVAYKNGIIATAGQDRRVVIYAYKFNSAYYKSSSFLIYSVGLSASGKLVAYSSDEDNNITVFNTITKSILGKFGGNKMTISKILFLDENRLLVSSDDKNINLYKIK